LRLPDLFQIFVDRDLERAQKTLVLVGELDFARGLEGAFGFRASFRGGAFVGIFVLVALIKADGCLKHQKNVVTRLLDLAYSFGDAIRV
jgi:hypothetical protein